METVMEYIEPRAKELQDSLTHFMLIHSEIEARKPYDEVWCFSPEGNRNYCDLDDIGRKMQSYLSECYGHFYTVLISYLNNQPEEVMTKLSKANTVITRTIEHRLTYCESSKEALGVALAALEEQMNIVRDVFEKEGR